MSEQSTQWFSLALGDGLMSISACTDIEAGFEPAYRTADCPSDMAVFKRHDFESSLHCEVTAFFSPAAAALARSLGAVSCAKPARSGLDLVAGDSSCWSVLFP